MARKIMAIGAHPDDVEFGCSGALIRHKSDGDFVSYVCMTDTESTDGTTGELLRTSEQNRNETLAASFVMGCDYVDFLPFKDLHVPFSFESVSLVEKLIKKYEIDTIYTHWAGDANQDHISTFRTTMAAARYVSNVFCYEQIPIARMSENQMDTNYYVNITNQFSEKIRSSMEHRSQIEKYEKHGLNVRENLETLAKFRGIQARCKYAEAFCVIKTVKE